MEKLRLVRPEKIEIAQPKLRYFYGCANGTNLEPPLTAIQTLYNATSLPDFTMPPDPEPAKTKKQAQQGQKMEYVF